LSLLQESKTINAERINILFISFKRLVIVNVPNSCFYYILKVIFSIINRKKTMGNYEIYEVGIIFVLPTMKETLL
jgi:hypothetical protein